MLPFCNLAIASSWALDDSPSKSWTAELVAQLCEFKPEVLCSTGCQSNFDLTASQTPDIPGSAEGYDLAASASAA